MKVVAVEREAWAAARGARVAREEWEEVRAAKEGWEEAVAVMVEEEV